MRHIRQLHGARAASETYDVHMRRWAQPLREGYFLLSNFRVDDLLALSA